MCTTALKRINLIILFNLPLYEAALCIAFYLSVCPVLTRGRLQKIKIGFTDFSGLTRDIIYLLIC